MDNWLPFNFFIVGFIFFWLFSTLFQRNDKNWMKFVFTTNGITFFSLPPALIAMFSVSKEYQLFAVGHYFIGSLCASIAITIIAKISLKDKGLAEKKVGLIDIVLGHSSIFEDFYKSRLKLDEAKKELEEKEADIIKKEQGLKEKEDALVQLSTNIKDKEQAVQAAVSSTFNIELPVNSSAPICDAYISLIPAYCDLIYKFSSFCSGVLNEIFLEEKIKEKFDSKFQLLEAYLLGICEAFSTTIGDSHNYRVHFRYLCGDTYVKLAASTGTSKYSDSLTPIPISESSLIQTAAETKRTIIYRYNEDLAFKNTTNNDIWKDYITIAFGEYSTKDNEVLLSMGISSKYTDISNNLFIFLTHIRFEQMVKEIIKPFNKKYGIKKIIAESEGNNG